MYGQTKNISIDAFTPGSTAVRVIYRSGGSRAHLERFQIVRTTKTQVVAVLLNSDGKPGTVEHRFTKGKWDWDFQEAGSKMEANRYSMSDAALLPEGDPRIAQAEEAQVRWDAKQARSRALYAVQNTMASWQRYGNVDASDDAIRAVIADLQAVLDLGADA